MLLHLFESLFQGFLRQVLVSLTSDAHVFLQDRFSRVCPDELLHDVLRINSHFGLVVRHEISEAHVLLHRRGEVHHSHPRLRPHAEVDCPIRTRRWHIGNSLTQDATHLRKHLLEQNICIASLPACAAARGHIVQIDPHCADAVVQPARFSWAGQLLGGLVSSHQPLHPRPFRGWMDCINVLAKELTLLVPRDFGHLQLLCAHPRELRDPLTQPQQLRLALATEDDGCRCAVLRLRLEHG
mmetsp:Transcript_63694/g.169767  ORF Transcript_63694/g.169767 Transcript_63694/m.169767 type:complete len:240 (+) Transcript_63694:619-1338(+)